MAHFASWPEKSDLGQNYTRALQLCQESRAV